VVPFFVVALPYNGSDKCNECTLTPYTPSPHTLTHSLAHFLQATRSPTRQSTPPSRLAARTATAASARPCDTYSSAPRRPSRICEEARLAIPGARIFRCLLCALLATPTTHKNVAGTIFLCVCLFLCRRSWFMALGTVVSPHIQSHNFIITFLRHSCDPSCTLRGQVSSIRTPLGRGPRPSQGALLRHGPAEQPHQAHLGCRRAPPG